MDTWGYLAVGPLLGRGQDLIGYQWCHNKKRGRMRIRVLLLSLFNHKE